MENDATFVSGNPLPGNTKVSMVNEEDGGSDIVNKDCNDAADDSSFVCSNGRSSDMDWCYVNGSRGMTLKYINKRRPKSCLKISPHALEQLKHGKEIHLFNSKSSSMMTVRVARPVPLENQILKEKFAWEAEVSTSTSPKNDDTTIQHGLHKEAFNSKLNASPSHSSLDPRSESFVFQSQPRAKRQRRCLSGKPKTGTSKTHQKKFVERVKIVKCVLKITCRKRKETEVLSQIALEPTCKKMKFSMSTLMYDEYVCASNLVRGLGSLGPVSRK